MNIMTRDMVLYFKISVFGFGDRKALTIGNCREQNKQGIKTNPKMKSVHEMENLIIKI